MDRFIIGFNPLTTSGRYYITELHTGYIFEVKFTPDGFTIVGDGSQEQIPSIKRARRWMETIMRENKLPR